MPKYLQKKRRQWYAVLDIPKPLQGTFGKLKFVQSLKTETQTIAENRVSSVITGWKKQIVLARSSGSNTSGELLNTVIKVRQDAQRLKAKGLDDWEIQMMHEEVAISEAIGEKNDYSGNHSLANAVSFVHGSGLLFAEHVDEFLESKTTQPKSKDMMRTDLGLFCKQFPTPETATRVKVKKWINVDILPEKKLSLNTRRRVLSACRVYWDWLEFNKQLGIAPPFTKA